MVFRAQRRAQSLVDDAGLNDAGLNNAGLQDAGLAAGFAGLAAFTGIVLVAPGVPAAPPDLVIVLWAAAFMGPLAVRRRWPLTVAGVMTAHFLVFWQTGQNNDIAAWLGLGAGLYAAGAYGRRPLARPVAASCLMVAVSWFVVQGATGADLGPAELVAVALFVTLPIALGWTLGSMMRQLRLYRAELEQRNAELDAQRAAQARRAVLEERVRIARELHDVVAHHVSLMTVQAAAARRNFELRPAQALDSITAVEDTGRAAITELQQLVGVLRRRDESRDLAPQPSLGQLPALVAHMEQAGLAVSLSLEAVSDVVPAGLGLSAYRIVQEALTNTLKHAGATRADVTVTYRDGWLDLDIVDDGGSEPGQLLETSGGRGLVGMRERVAVYGGTLDAGPRPEPGYRVHARLRGTSS